VPNKIEQPLADAPSLAKASLERLRVNLSTDVVVWALTPATGERPDQIRLECGSRTQKPAKPSRRNPLLEAKVSYLSWSMLQAFGCARGLE